jgi:hypothetical protein
MAISAEADSIHCRKRVEDKLIRPHSSKSRSSFAVSENALSSLRYRETILIQHVHGCPHDQDLFIFSLTRDGNELDTGVAVDGRVGGSPSGCHQLYRFWGLRVTHDDIEYRTG